MIDRSVAARRALAEALRDAHPAVRAAAATSLGGSGDLNQVIALRELARDPEAPVRNAARASIDRLEAPVPLDTAATTAALTLNRL